MTVMQATQDLGVPFPEEAWPSDQWGTALRLGEVRGAPIREDACLGAARPLLFILNSVRRQEELALGGSRPARFFFS